MTATDSPAEDLPLRGLPQMQPGNGFDLLQGVRVLDLTTSVAGPFATMLLGDLGAEIIKIERPGGGDDARAWGPPFLDGQSLWFLSVNRNKQSVALDYSKPEGLELLKQLVAKCDVVVLNQPARVAAKLGVDAASLQTVRSDLIHVSITGFGLDGERADWPCYDLIAEGYSGVMDITGEPDSAPQKIGTPAADMLAGQDAAMATLAALFARARTGKGRVIDISLVDSMTRFLTCRIVPFLGSGEVPQRSGGRDSVIAIYQAFDTADEPITVGLGNDAIWQRFWKAVGEPEYGADPRFATNAGRREHRAEIVAHIQGLLRSKSRSHWLTVLRGARVPAGPINRVDQVAQDAELQRRGLLYALEAGGRLVPQVGTGLRLDGEVNVPRSAPPNLGEHTFAVLDRLLDTNDRELAALTAAGVVAGAAT